jgi:malate dehydrogenase
METVGRASDPECSRRSMKIVIVGGAGGVGSSVAFNLARLDVPAEIVLIDQRSNMIESHTMDIEDVIALGGAELIRGGEPADALDADVVVIAASVPLRLNASRSEFLTDNARIVQDVVAPLGADFPGAILLMTNPTDALVSWLVATTGLDRSRVLGYALNDSLRFRFGVAQALGIHPRRVGALVAGEHGQHQVPLFSTVVVDGERVTPSVEQRRMAEEYMDTWYAKHVALDSGRTSTWSSGLGGALMIEAMAVSSPEPFPTSMVLTGEYGIDGVAVGVPALLGPRGARGVLSLDLAAEELARLRAGAEHVEAGKGELLGLLGQTR